MSLPDGDLLRGDAHDQAPDQVLAGLLLQHADLVTRRMQGRIERELPMIGDLPDDVRSELDEYLQRVAVTALQLVIRGEALDGLGPLMEETARRRRSQRITPEQSLRGYEVAQQALLDEVALLVRDRPDEGLLLGALTRRLLEFQRVIAIRVAAGFQAETEPPGRDGDLQRLLELLTGRRADDEDVGALAARLGVTLPLGSVHVTAARVERTGPELRHVRNRNPWSVAGILDGRLVVLAPREARDVPAPYGLADLPEHASSSVVAAAVARAGRAADVAARLGVPSISSGAAAPLAALLAVPDGDRAAFLRSCFGDLPDSPRGEPLLSSVAALLTLQKAADAARVLHVHRHTLDYRLRRFTEETGMDLSDPATRFRCEIGLFLLGRMPFRGAQK